MNRKGVVGFASRGMFCKHEDFASSCGSGDLVNDDLGTFSPPCGGPRT
jgi:hypothetical protein